MNPVVFVDACKHAVWDLDYLIQLLDLEIDTSEYISRRMRDSDVPSELHTHGSLEV